MVAASSVVRVTGYSVRVWFALDLVRRAVDDDRRKSVLLSLESLREWFRPAAMRLARERARAVGAELRCIPMVPNKLPGAAWLNRAWGAWVVRWIAWRSGARVVHAHSHMAAGISARALRRQPGTPLVFDIHGVEIEERLADGRLQEGTRNLRAWKLAESEALRRANWLFPVSLALAQHVLEEEHDMERVRIVPCVSSLPISDKDPEHARRVAREVLEVTSMPVVLYLGGASAWQRPKFILKCFSELRRTLPSAVLLVITRNPEEFRLAPCRRRRTRRELSDSLREP